MKPDPEEPYDYYVLYTSGPYVNKGPHLLLEAWPEVCREFRGLRLYMVGCEGSWVEGLAKRLGLKNVVFTKRLPPDHYYHLMYRARAVVMPSVWPEAFGRIPVEANRLGVPAVVSDRGALPEVVEPGVSGLVAEADACALAVALTKILSSDFDRKKIIESVTRRINVGEVLNKFLDFLNTISCETLIEAHHKSRNMYCNE